MSDDLKKLEYRNHAGEIQYKVPAEMLNELEYDNAGWCLACAEVQYGVEPDAVKYECESCGKRKVYGVAELALMGLVYTGD